MTSDWLTKSYPQDLEEAGIKVPDGKIGKKKLEKLQAKADKKLQREAEQREREENKKRRDKIEEEEKRRRDLEREEELRQEEEETSRREEKERKEQEEYEALKAAFSVEGEGCDAEDEGDEENRSGVDSHYTGSFIFFFDSCPFDRHFLSSFLIIDISGC